MERWTCYSC